MIYSTASLRTESWLYILVGMAALMHSLVTLGSPEDVFPRRVAEPSVRPLQQLISNAGAAKTLF